MKFAIISASFLEDGIEMLIEVIQRTLAIGDCPGSLASSFLDTVILYCYSS